MPSGNIIAAKELLLLMLIEHDLATFLVCFRSRGGRTVDCVRSNFTLLIVLPVLVGVVVCVESNMIVSFLALLYRVLQCYCA